jgi:hypothetical protein
MNVKRYNSTAKEVSEELPSGCVYSFSGMEEHPTGEYVSFEDYKWMSDYADRLVEHKDMVCLPADLANLREANAALAQENFELKQQLLKK